MEPALRLMLIISVSWITLLMVLAFIGNAILPLLNSVTPRYIDIVRLAIAAVLFVTWLAWWFALSRYVVYRAIRREGTGRYEREGDAL